MIVKSSAFIVALLMGVSGHAGRTTLADWQVLPERDRVSQIDAMRRNPSIFEQGCGMLLRDDNATILLGLIELAKSNPALLDDTPEQAVIEYQMRSCARFR